MTFPPASRAATVIVVVAGTPAVNCCCATDNWMDVASPFTPTLTEKGAPDEMTATAVPFPKSGAVAFGPPYSATENVSLPTGAATGIEQVRTLPAAVQSSDVADTSAMTGRAIPETVIATETADGERNALPLPRASAVFAGIVRISAPFATCAGGCDPIGEPPPPLHAANPHSAASTKALRVAGNLAIFNATSGTYAETKRV